MDDALIIAMLIGSAGAGCFVIAIISAVARM